MSSQATPPPVPKSFFEFLKAFGPGIVIVLTWLGAGDVVDMGVAGSNYGYSLLWVLVVGIFMRFVLVSAIGRYQLCNPHGDGVLDGLVRFHPAYAPISFFGAVLLGHVAEAYTGVGAAEVCRNVFGGQLWMWGAACNALALWLILKGGYQSLESLFKVFLALLSISFIGSAMWVGFSGLDVLQGLYRWEIPGQRGEYQALTVATAMIGAVGGSFMNLVYPYFLEEKGWNGPRYRRLQVYDLLLGIVVMIILNLSVWILGAQLLYPDQHISTLEDLPNLLSTVLGPGGRLLFYLGIFSAVFTSLVGHAVGLSMVGSHAWIWWRTRRRPTAEEYRTHPAYRRIVLWCLITPLIWTIPGMPDFVALTLAGNSAQVVLVPLLSGGVWRITASAKYIGESYRNRWWENAVLAILFGFALYAASQTLSLLIGTLSGS